MPELNTLTGSQLHEPKGADTATSGHVYVADGAGSGSFQAYVDQDLNTTDSPTFVTLNLATLPIYTGDVTAGVGGLVAGDLYKTAAGEVRVKL